MLLSRAPNIEVAGEAASAAEAIVQVEALQPDVVLLDVRLGDGNGFEVSRKIQTFEKDIRVLVLTSFADDDIIVQAISSGADGYLLKEVGRDALIEAVQKVASGQSILDPAVTGRVFGKVQALMQDPTSGNKLRLLSSQEGKVLALVAEGKTNKEIAAVLGLSDKTIKNYFSNILEKLGLSRRSQAAAYFVQHSH
jgi:DNA-binding NarL/FixJ family response regulator